MKLAIRSLACTLACAGMLALPALAAPPAKGGKPGQGGAPGEAGDKPYQEWKKVTKDSEALKGFFTLHRKRENLYLELAPNQLDTPVLGVLSFSRGLGKSRIFGGMPIWTGLLEFQRTGDRVLVVMKNTRFTAPAGSPYEKAKDLSYGHSVVASLKIESVHDSSKALLVDLAPLVVSDLADVGEAMRDAIGKTMRFDKDRSALTSVKTFPENTEIEALLTYSPSDRLNLDLNTVPDDRYLPVTVHYSFSKLPEQPMAPRMADDRVGYFLTAKKDFSRDSREHFWVRYVNRWRLEKKDPTAALSEPVKPIVFYIDHTVPHAFRPYVKRGIEAWQVAFEAAGFKNAIIAKDAPDDPDWDPEDVRYSTIRWIVSSEPAFGAIGPSRVDPRSGEILDADILFEGSIVQRRWKVYRDLVGPDALAQSTLPTLQAMADPHRCDAQMGMMDGLALAHMGSLIHGDLPPGSPIQEQFVGEMLVHTTLHEVGHTLGLRHNFRSSTATPLARLHDRGWSDERGLMGSVMDYATPNISQDRTKQGPYYGSRPGTYDLWAIRYGYAPSGTADVEADRTFAAEIAAASAAAGNEYSPDEDTYGPDALDPRSNIWDLGDDPLEFAKARTTFVSSLWKQDSMEERILGPQGEYPVLRRAMDGLLEQYAIALGLAVKYVGGQYQDRSHRGQPDARVPLEPVAAARQREALAFLGERGFATDAFAISPALLNRLAADRWLHWGMGDNFSVYTGPRLDYNLNDKILAIQTTLVSGLMNPNLLARLREAESRSAEPFRVAELYDRMTRMLWGEVGGATPAAIKSLERAKTRRELQRFYVDRLASQIVSPAPGTPDDARALARLQLGRIDARAAKALAGEAPMGDYTRAHLLESRARIKRALDAGMEVGVRPAAGGGPTATP